MVDEIMGRRGVDRGETVTRGWTQGCSNVEVRLVIVPVCQSPQMKIKGKVCSSVTLNARVITSLGSDTEF